MKIKYDTEYVYLTKRFEICLLRVHIISYQAGIVSVGFFDELTSELIWSEFSIDDFNNEVVSLLGEL